MDLVAAHILAAELDEAEVGLKAIQSRMTAGELAQVANLPDAQDILLLLRTFAAGVRSRKDLTLENLALRHQLQVALRRNPHLCR